MVVVISFKIWCAFEIIQTLVHLLILLPQTMNNPNSWATVSQWRRYFEYEDEREREQEDAIAEIIDEQYTNETMRPIATEQSQQFLRHETLQAYRLQQIRSETQPAPVMSEPPTRPDQERMQPRRSLEIPVGEDEARYLPQ